MDPPAINQLYLLSCSLEGNPVHVSLSYISPAYAYDNVTAS